MAHSTSASVAVACRRPDPRTSVRRKLARSFIPFALLLIVVLLANFGVNMTRDADAATSTVTVNATVSAVASTATNGCANAIGFTITGGTYSSGNCTLTFGSTNTSGITLSVDDNTQADQFMTLNAGNFADAAADCSAMAATDQVGYKVLTGGTATVNKCVASVTGNTQISDIPNDVPGVVGADIACTTSAVGTQTCPIEVGTFEAGSNATSGAYTGTILFTSS
jgi:hypothetical protein